MTIEERMENMECELGRVKRRNRWMLGVVLLLAGGLGAVGVLKTTAGQEAGEDGHIHAKSILLKGDDSQSRIVMFAGDGMAPTLMMSDENNTFRAALTVNINGPELTMWDANAIPRASLAVGEKGPIVSLYDEKKQARIRLGINKDEPGLVLFDEQGNLRAGIIVNTFGPFLNLFDETGGLRFAAGKSSTVTPDGMTVSYPESSLFIYGPDGKVIWSAIN